MIVVGVVDLSSGIYEVAHNISNLDMVRSIKCTAYNTNINAWMILPHPDLASVNSNINVLVNSTNIRFKTSNTGWGTYLKRVTVTLEYTKTTD